MSSAVAAPREPSLYWRLLPSYLLVVVVAAGTALLAGEALAPFFLQRHVDAMMETLHAHGDQTLDAMADDLETGFRRALTQSLLWALAVSALAASLVGLYVTRRVVRPLRALTRASRRIAGGRYSQRLDARAPGEIGELAAADAFRPRFEAKGVAMNVRPVPSGLSVWADEERIGQVLGNLIANALRFTPQGGGVTLTAAAIAGGRVRFDVSDTGVGIPPEQLALVFNRFYRGDEARAQRDGSGSGIGLTLAKQLVERQGGEIGVSSLPGEGSSFWFTLSTRP